MRVVVIGAGPVGTFCALALARRGCDVVAVDRDPGPPGTGAWTRRGVMQFAHPHFFRPAVREALLELLPDVWAALLRAGGVPARLDGMPEATAGLACRRSTFERTIRAVARQEPRLTVRTGHAERISTSRGRVTGVVVDGATVAADLVIVATGRGGRLADELRAPADGGSCGFSYVSRMYRARPGAEAPTGGPMGALYRGYLAIVFPQDDRTLSTLLVRASTDDRLALLRHQDCFDAVAALVPRLAPWTDPARVTPITGVLAGGGLTNSYRGQLDTRGRVPVSGLFFVGDAVCTTNPAAGRGVALGLGQARALIGMLGGARADHREVAHRFDAWCTAMIRPWFEDHVYWDASLLRRFRGEDIDPDARIPSDVVCAAAAVDPTIWPAAAPYLGMLALPSVLDGAPREKARALLRTGWRPPIDDGPTRDELAEVLTLPVGRAC